MGASQVPKCLTMRKTERVRGLLTVAFVAGVTPRLRMRVSQRDARRAAGVAA